MILAWLCRFNNGRTLCVMSFCENQPSSKSVYIPSFIFENYLTNMMKIHR